MHVRWCARGLSITLVLTCVAAGLLVNADEKAATQPSGPTTAPGTAAIRNVQWKTLAELLEAARGTAGLPALAAAVAQGDRVVDVAAVGVRRIDQSNAVEATDCFHIGSITKAMTATMIARLVEEGLLRWDLTLREALPDVGMRPEYKAVTLGQLLHHRGGIRPYTDRGLEDASADVKALKTATEQRRAFVAQVLSEAPRTPVGEYAYSNAGYTIAGHIAERVARRPWEDLLRENVFRPLRLASASFGWPVTSERSDAPWGHWGTPPDLEPQVPGVYDLGWYLAPAGDVQCTVEDLVRFGMFHVRGLRGADGWLKAETIRRLHQPPTADGMGYACGWVVGKPEGERLRHWHNGSAGTFFALLVIYPDDDVVVAVVTNAGPLAESAVEQVAAAIAERYVSKQ